MSTKHRGRIAGDPVTYRLPTPAGGVRLETFVPWTLVKRGAKKEVITPLDAPQAFVEEAQQERQARASAEHTALLRALGLAHHWQRLLDEQTGDVRGPDRRGRGGGRHPGAAPAAADPVGPGGRRTAGRYARGGAGAGDAPVMAAPVG